MEAAALPQRPRASGLSGDKATRIVEAMRASVAVRGIAGSTFDHVSREAGVSRALLHYYFGTDERLRATPTDIAGLLFAVADGVTIRRLSEPEFDVRRLMDQAVSSARAVLK